MKKLFMVLSFLSGMCLAAYVVLRPMMLRWGTREDEDIRPLPGDDLILHPHIRATYAVDIPAAPRVVWFWLLKLVSAGTGLDALQALQSDVPTVPVDVDAVLEDGYRVVEKQAERLLVLSGPADDGIATTHIWVLEATSPNQTRLIFRYSQAAYGLSGILYNILSEPKQFAVRQIMLKALRQRAQSGSESVPEPESAVFGIEKSNGNIRIPLER